jgi:hypothetical protein
VGGVGGGGGGEREGWGVRGGGWKGSNMLLIGSFLERLNTDKGANRRLVWVSGAVIPPVYVVAGGGGGEGGATKKTGVGFGGGDERQYPAAEWVVSGEVEHTRGQTGGLCG